MGRDRTGQEAGYSQGNDRTHLNSFSPTSGWYAAHRLLGDLYLDDKPDQAVLCYQEFRKSEGAGADSMYKLGRAYENLGDYANAARCYEVVTGYEQHPLYYEARDALDRVRRGLRSVS